MTILRDPKFWYDVSQSRTRPIPDNKRLASGTFVCDGVELSFIIKAYYVHHRCYCVWVWIEKHYFLEMKFHTKLEKIAGTDDYVVNLDKFRKFEMGFFEAPSMEDCEHATTILMLGLEHECV